MCNPTLAVAAASSALQYQQSVKQQKAERDAQIRQNEIALANLNNRRASLQTKITQKTKKNLKILGIKEREARRNKAEFKAFRPSLSLTLTPDTTVCFNQPIWLTALGAGGSYEDYSYIWNGVIGKDSLLINFTSDILETSIESYAVNDTTIGYANMLFVNDAIGANNTIYKYNLATSTFCDTIIVDSPVKDINFY